MPNAGPNPWGTSADNAAIGVVAWSGTGTPGSPGITINSPTNTPSHYLALTNFGFSLSGSGTIVGIQASLSVSVVGGTGFDHSAKLIIGGSIVGTDKATSTTATSWTWGGLSDTWGTTPTVANVNASNFGFAFSVGTVGGLQANLATATIEIAYTTPSGGSLDEDCVDISRVIIEVGDWW